MSWSQSFSNNSAWLLPTTDFCQAGSIHKTTCTLPLCSLDPLFCPTLGRWAEEWRFLKLAKPKETHFSVGSNPSGHTHFLNCTINIHEYSSSETIPEAAMLMPLCAHSRQTQNTSKAILETEKIIVIMKWNFSPWFWRVERGQKVLRMPNYALRKLWFSSRELHGSNYAKLLW